MIREQFIRIIERRATLLGVGPMSTNCIDAAIEVSGKHNVPIMLIASRRQIDSEDFNGGYVNNWTTQNFSDYVLEKDKIGNIILCRDHGGPWQNTIEKEKNLGLRMAMESAKISFLRDIEAGFQILHIDPSVDIHRSVSTTEIVDRVLELYEYCWEKATVLGRKVEFEIGTEEQSGSTSSTAEFTEMLTRVNRHCNRYKMPTPLFVVVQNGTKVLETQNVGSFDVPVRVADEIPPEIQVPLMSKICTENGVFMKAHNTDYLSNSSLEWYPRLGIHSANVAPEFGIVETLTFLQTLENNGLQFLAEKFIELASGSNKWEKWMKEGSKASERDKAVIAGHYIYATDEYRELFEESRLILLKEGLDLNQILKENVKKSILRYLKAFRMIRG